VNDTLTPEQRTTTDDSATEFESLYRDYRSRVFSTAYRMVSNRADAEDITQDVFVKVFKKLGSFRGDAAVSTWIYRITVNACLDFLRRRKLRQTVPLDESMTAGSQPMSVGKLIEGTLPRLPPGYREVFVLYDIQGLKHSEIAQVLGISEGASKSQLHRARAFMRRELAPYIESMRWLKEV
jgi:RNA polymerase sigma-70 factor, ECF subfamily